MTQVTSRFEAAQLLAPGSQANRAPRQPESVYKKRRQRVLIGAAAVALTAAAVAPSVGSWLSNRVQGDPVDIPEGSEPYLVQPGDTATTIAASYELQGDLRPLIDEIQAAGDSVGADGLQAGEEIPVPVGVDTRR